MCTFNHFSKFRYEEKVSDVKACIFFLHTKFVQTTVAVYI